MTTQVEGFDVEKFRTVVTNAHDSDEIVMSKAEATALLARLDRIGASIDAGFSAALMSSTGPDGKTRCACGMGAAPAGKHSSACPSNTWQSPPPETEG